MLLDKSELKEKNQDAVVFFDFENIVYSLRHLMGKNPNFEILMEKCQEYGRIVLARAYADWSRHSTVIAPLQASGFDPVYVPTYYYDNQERRTRKNAVDIHIAIEAVEVMFTQPQINTFVLLTGDKDFIPLANALRRYGKTVIAIGVRGTTSPYMRQATDDFIFYHQLLDEPIDRKRKSPRKDIYESLVEAVEKLESEGQKTVFPAVKHTLSELLGSFDEKSYKDSDGVPFNRFKDFILEAQRLGHVKLVTTGSVNEVLLPGEDISLPELIEQPDQGIEETALESEAPIEEIIIKTPPDLVTDLEGAFELLVWAVYHAQSTGKSPRASSIKTIMRGAVHDFDEKILPEESFSKFSDFTRAASRRGLVRITGKGILMEIHPPEVDASAKKLEPLPVEEVSALEPIVDSQTEELPGTEDDDLVPLSSIEPEDERVSAEQTQPYISDYRMRVLVSDALRNCPYPAPAHMIGQHCLDLSESRQVSLPNRRLNQLLTTAREIGLLQPSGDGEPNQYTFVEDPELVSQFLDREDE